MAEGSKALDLELRSMVVGSTPSNWSKYGLPQKSNKVPSVGVKVICSDHRHYVRTPKKVLITYQHCPSLYCTRLFVIIMRIIFPSECWKERVHSCQLNFSNYPFWYFYFLFWKDLSQSVMKKYANITTSLLPMLMPAMSMGQIRYHNLFATLQYIWKVLLTLSCTQTLSKILSY